MAEPDAVASDDMVEELVHQFSDPFAFYRELIQNGIDAGSSRIEVTLSFKPSRGKGLATAQVQDWGEGMNRQIIEGYLLTKFRSSKENDLTKIGKFGIGFVSIFAPDPDLVLLETGRDGESWRLLFQRDRSYELLKNSSPVDGTRVAIHKEMTATEYRDFAKRSYESVQRWCRYSEADIAFAASDENGSLPVPVRSIRQPLQVDAPFQVEYREEGTSIVAGPSRKDPPECGLYNRGLTLLESNEVFFEGVTFRIVSRYLEHTLTRDNVRRDKQFERALGMVKKLVDGPLRERLPDELRRLAQSQDQWPDYLRVLRYCVGKLKPDELWFRQAAGGAVQGRELRRSNEKTGGLLVATANDPIVGALSLEEVPVLLVDPDKQFVSLAQKVLGAREVLNASSVFCLARPAAEGAGEPGKLLSAALRSLLTSTGARIDDISVVSLYGSGADRIAVCLESIGRCAPAASALRSPFQRPVPLLGLNVSDPRIAAAVKVSRSSPRLAAMLVLRVLASMFHALNESTDWRLTELLLSR